MSYDLRKCGLKAFAFAFLQSAQADQGRKFFVIG